MALKRHCQVLSLVEDDEWIDFATVVRKLEKSLEQTFHPTIYNWSCFKNSTFRSKNPDPEVHWHFIPRYKYPVDFEGVIFQDPDFGYIPLPVQKEIPRKIINKMAIKIKKQLS